MPKVRFYPKHLDPQRDRVYDAERAVFGRNESRPSLTRSECVALARKAVHPHVPVRFSRGRTSHAGPHGITLSDRYGRNINTVLHESAHVLSPGGGHTAAWAACHLGLVRYHLGDGVADALSASYDAHLVSYQPNKTTMLRLPRSYGKARLDAAATAAGLEVRKLRGAYWTLNNTSYVLAGLSALGAAIHLEGIVTPIVIACAAKMPAPTLPATGKGYQYQPSLGITATQGQLL
jgi:hypothetical protein